MNWAEVRYQHVVALRAVLIENGAQPATINHVLSADTWRDQGNVAPRAARRRVYESGSRDVKRRVSE